MIFLWKKTPKQMLIIFWSFRLIWQPENSSPLATILKGKHLPQNFVGDGCEQEFNDGWCISKKSWWFWEASFCEKKNKAQRTSFIERFLIKLFYTDLGEDLWTLSYAPLANRIFNIWTKNLYAEITFLPLYSSKPVLSDRKKFYEEGLTRGRKGGNESL